MTRLVLVSGKGGVGKTTIAAATAVRAAQAGHRTLVVSVDRAHNLGEVLGTKLGPTPGEVAGQPSLFAMEADAQTELRAHEGMLRGYFARLLSWAGVSSTQADEVAVIPGLEELLVLSRLAALLEDDAFELVVVDLAPTGSSLKLLSFPELMAGPLGRLARWERQFLNLTRPAVKRLWSVPVPDDELYQAFEVLAARIKHLHEVLIDRTRTTVRLVCIPERVVVDETRSAFTLMCLFGLAVDLVVLNRVLPDDLVGTSLEAWVRIQAREIDRANSAFGRTPVRPLGFQPTEVLGLEQLALVGRTLYGEQDPALPLIDAAPICFEQGAPALTIALPHRDAAGALDLQQQADELIITLGAWRRRLLLPPSLRDREVRSARLSAGQLRVEFTERKERPP